MTENADQYRLVNPVLRSVMRQVYQNRQNFPIRYYADTRVERINDKSFCQLFFLSKGCTHDADGGCTMCNYGYGKSYEINESAVLAEIRREMENLPHQIQEIVLGPIGSMMDDKEVSPEFRKQIFEALSTIECQEFTCETRADSITAEKLRVLKRQLRMPKITLEIGVETLNPWCLRNCVNKNCFPSQIEEAVTIAHREGIRICANVGIGIPFLSESCGIRLAVEAISALLALNVESIVLFPYNIRPGTLLEWLWQNGLYSCVSLWTLPEILSYFSGEDLSRIQISWYRNYYQDTSKILCMPSVCPDCNEKVLMLFDQYRNHPGEAALRPLLNYGCPCRERWQRSCDAQKDSIQFEQVERAYRAMAKGFEIDLETLEQELVYMKNKLEEYKR